MDRYDPNEWTGSFVRENHAFCLEQLRGINDQIIELVQDGNYTAAVAGLDRVLNGLVTMQNAGGDYRSQMCFFSWIEAHIMLFGIGEAAEDRRRDTALKALEDARDFAKSDSAKQTLSAMISDLRGGRSIDALKQDYNPDFPATDIEMLTDLNDKLTAPASSSGSRSSSSSSSGSSSSGCGKGCFTFIIIIAILAVVGYFAMKYFNIELPDKNPTEASVASDAADN